MEASEALGGAQAAAGETGGGEGGGEAAADPNQAILDRFDQLDRSFDERFQGIDERFESLGRGGQEQAGQLNGENGEPLLFVDPETGAFSDEQGNAIDLAQLSQGESGDGRQQVSQEVIDGIRNGLSAQMQQQLAPILNEFQDMKADKLMDQYPAFKDDKYAEKIVGQAEQWAESRNAPHLATDTDFVELLHLAEIGRGRAAGDGSQTGGGASETEVALETGGVTPAGGQDDLESRIDSALDRRQKAESIWD